MKDKYYGYVFLKNGKHKEKEPKEPFDDVKIAMNWLKEQSQSYWRVILTDVADCCAAEVIDGKATYPPALVAAQNEGRF